MGSAEHGEMPTETPGAPEVPLPPVGGLPAIPVLTPLAPAIEAATAAAEAKEAEAPEPSSSKPDAGDGRDQETELKVPEGLTVNEAMEFERDSKRQRMTPSEVAAEGMPDTELTLKMLRLCQSSLEYTARQSKALQEAAERDKQFGDVLLALQGQVADAYARGSGIGGAAPATAGTPVTPVGGAPVGMGSVGAAAAAFPPQVPTVMQCGAAMGPMASSYVPPPPAHPAPSAPTVPRNPIVLQVRQPDYGNVVQRSASPTRHLDDGLRSNPSYIWCDDNCFRRLL
eukprot:s3385_g10.t1